MVHEKREAKEIELKPGEREVIELISEAPLYVDEIAERLERPVQEILTRLLDMEMRGIIKQLPGNRYIKVY